MNNPLDILTGSPITPCAVPDNTGKANQDNSSAAGAQTEPARQSGQDGRIPPAHLAGGPITPISAPVTIIQPQKTEIPKRFVHTKLPLKGLQSFAVWGAAFIAAILVFGILTQILHYYSIIASLPVVSQWIFILCGGFCTAVIFTVLAKISIFFFRFRQSDNLELQAIQLLNERGEWQYYAEANATANKARKILAAYLKDFDIDSKDTEKLFVKDFLLDRADYDAMCKARKTLLAAASSPSDGLSPQQWLKKFQEDFQSKLDTLAKQRVSQYYYKVFAGTAISPRALIDQIIITSACVAMIQDLMQIYRLKPAPGRTLFLAAHGLFNIYAGGEMQENAANIVDNLSAGAVNIFSRIFHNEEMAVAFGPTVMNAIPFLGSGIQFAAAKIAEGTMNALLIRNLGKKMIDWLQPTRIK